MRNFKKIICAVLSVLMACSCMSFAVSAEEESAPLGTTGEFNLINFNVAGLPIPASETEDGRDALMDTIEIGQKLNKMGYDIIAVQEDFNYDLYLRDGLTNYTNTQDASGNVTERHATEHSGGVPLGDGLNVFTTFVQYNEDRETWEESAGVTTDGSDELTLKGILKTTVKVAEGYYVDIYNIHADAYDQDASADARKAQYAQLADYIKRESVYDKSTNTYDHAVIVTGDFNSSLCTEDYEGEAALIKYLVEPAMLNDAWAIQTISEIVENPADYSAYYTYAAETDLTYTQSQGHYDSVERICFADGNGIDLTVDSFGYIQIYGADGEPLSDHCAAIADFSFEIVEKVQDNYNDHDEENVEQNKNFLIRFLEYIASIFQALGKLLQDWTNWA